MTIFQMSCSQWMYSNNYIFTYKKNHLNSHFHSSFNVYRINVDMLGYYAWQSL